MHDSTKFCNEANKALQVDDHCARESWKTRMDNILIFDWDWSLNELQIVEPA